MQLYTADILWHLRKLHGNDRLFWDKLGPSQQLYWSDLLDSIEKSRSAKTNGSRSLSLLFQFATIGEITTNPPSHEFPAADPPIRVILATTGISRTNAGVNYAASEIALISLASSFSDNLPLFELSTATSPTASTIERVRREGLCQIPQAQLFDNNVQIGYLTRAESKHLREQTVQQFENFAKGWELRSVTSADGARKWFLPIADTTKQSLWPNTKFPRNTELPGTYYRLRLGILMERPIPDKSPRAPQTWV